MVDEMIAPCYETRLPTILSDYALADVYNKDEFVLFFQALPEKTMHLKSEKCVGGKHSKIRLTGLAVANALGDKLPMFVIGKAKSPRCFKNLKSMPVATADRKKAGWTAICLRSAFESWMASLYERIGKLC